MTAFTAAHMTGCGNGIEREPFGVIAADKGDHFPLTDEILRGLVFFCLAVKFGKTKTMRSIGACISTACSD